MHGPEYSMPHDVNSGREPVGQSPRFNPHDRPTSPNRDSYGNSRGPDPKLQAGQSQSLTGDPVPSHPVRHERPEELEFLPDRGYSN